MSINEFLRNNICIFRAKRERGRKVTYETNKCLYELPPFDDHFDPLVHNTYLSRWEELMIISWMISFTFFCSKERSRHAFKTLW